MLVACGSVPQEPIDRRLPDAPAFAKPVEVPDPQAGESALVIAAREREGRKQANRIIVGYNQWYLKVQQDYSVKGQDAWAGMR